MGKGHDLTASISCAGDEDRAMASFPSTTGTAKASRHYPLDLPELPFHRYEHRPLSPRDLMVHRIMKAYMNPATLPPGILMSPLVSPAKFGPIREADDTLGQDLQVLTKMLFTRYNSSRPILKHAPLPPKVPLDELSRQSIKDMEFAPNKGGWYGSMDDLHKPFPAADSASVPDKFSDRRRVPDSALHLLKPATIGDQILDLVTRHYLESDDAALRTWIKRAQPPGVQVPPEETPNEAVSEAGPTLARPKRKVYLRTFAKDVAKERLRHKKRWYPDNTAHVRSFDRAMAVQQKRLLYDGGAFLPHLAQVRDQEVAGAHGAKHGVNKRHWALLQAVAPELKMPHWPETAPNNRFIFQESWKGAKDLASAMKRSPARPLDLNLEPGRGRNRDGIWTTGRTPQGQVGMEDQDGQLRGRHARVRKRSSSEPPLDAFLVAQLPTPHITVNKAPLQILAPRMKLSRLDARSRRRSLSRTRIEEMFDWDFCFSTRSTAETFEDASLWDKLSKEMNLLVAAQKPHQTPSGKARNEVHSQARKKVGIQAPKLKPREACKNCLSTGHTTSECKAPCGHCGAPSPVPLPRRRVSVYTSSESEPDHPNPFQSKNPHRAPDCPVSPTNRCKCGPFPTYHPATRCPIRCRRACGHAVPPGCTGHRNAMTCRARCCMCGLAGHSGRACRMRTCRCGGRHLGQDCTWNPTCRVRGCERYWCGMHCRGCGSGEKPLRDWRCWRCWGRTEPFPEKKGRRKPGRKEGMGGQDGQDVEGVAEDPVEQVHEEEGAASSEVAPQSIFGGPSYTESQA